MAKTIYLVRHQKAGIITTHAFGAPPTHAQTEPIIAEAVRVHGRDGWVRIHEMQLLGDGEVPVIESPASTGVASMPTFEARGEGTVTPPKTKHHK